MHVIAIICQKGGTGKTTVATELAVLASRDDLATVLLDLDPQASATIWADDRGGEMPQVIPAQAPRLAIMLTAAERQGAEVVIVDTGPSADSAALAAAHGADLILVPAKPTIRDMRALAPTLRTISDAMPGKRIVVMLSMVPPVGAVTAECLRYLAAAHIEVCPVQLHQRAAFYNGLGAGRSSIEWEPAGKAASEAKELWRWVRAQTGINVGGQAGIDQVTHEGMHA
jgi:chromosome partitioning protein